MVIRSLMELRWHVALCRCFEHLLMTLLVPLSSTPARFPKAWHKIDISPSGQSRLVVGRRGVI